MTKNLLLMNSSEVLKLSIDSQYCIKIGSYFSAAIYIGLICKNIVTFNSMFPFEVY